ncbi:hypothetical protein KGM48_02120 [Patescibacteria group bacterium]|nr:hypothetical protein [Patescibacteria group bacterium]
MTAAILAFVFLQTIGAFVGAGAAVWGEIAYVRAHRDGKVDRAERLHLESIAAGLRIGMLLLLLSSLGIIITSYLLRSSAPPATLSNYWTLMALALLVVWATWALSRRRISFVSGSALVFSAWWFLVYLTLGWLPGLSFGSAFAAFVVVTALFYALLQAIRHFMLRRK